ncbi:MAG: hypothetical protein IJN57_05305 [Oscillospiraceae bacterium]|nr:hypothetical protein [Oscillospiraceae bacterium]
MLGTILEYAARLTGASIGQLPAKGGISVEPAPASAGETYLDGTSSDNASLLFLCKSKGQRDALDQLCSICGKLTRTKHHPHGIYHVHVSTYPNYVSRDGDFWVYSCIINLKYYNKEGF